MTTTPAERPPPTQQRPWANEPNELKGSHGDIPWIIRRAAAGHLCGYIAVPPGHPWHNKTHDQIHQTHNINIHGGLTFTGRFDWTENPTKAWWWIGFDCGHGGDILPQVADQTGHTFDGDTYKPISYVHTETQRLANQAATAATKQAGDQA